MQALKALMRREATLVQRNSFLYIFKAVQVSDAYMAGTHKKTSFISEEGNQRASARALSHAVSYACRMPF